MLAAAATSAPPAFTPASSTPAWRAVENAVREACVLRAEGREAEATALLRDAVQPLIATWARTSGLTTPECQQALRELFVRVQEQVATAVVCKRLVLRSTEVQARLGRTTGGAVQVHRRVPIGDIPGMLDALDEGERIAALQGREFSSVTETPTAGSAGMGRKRSASNNNQLAVQIP